MDPAYPSFQLVEFIPPAGLTGRNCGTDLETGMTFNRVRRTRVSGDIQNIQSEDVGEPRAIALRLDRIEAYQTTLDDLSPGMTALLEVSGDDLEAICSELASLPDKESLSIEFA